MTNDPREGDNEIEAGSIEELEDVTPLPADLKT